MLSRMEAEADQWRQMAEMGRVVGGWQSPPHSPSEAQEAESQGPAQSLTRSEFVCMICKDHKPVGDVFRLAACSCSEDQSCCIECMREWVQSEIGSQVAGPPPFCSCSS